MKPYVASMGRANTSPAVATYFSGLPFFLATFGSFVISNKVARLTAVPRMTSNSRIWECSSTEELAVKVVGPPETTW